MKKKRKKIQVNICKYKRKYSYKTLFCDVGIQIGRGHEWDKLKLV